MTHNELSYHWHNIKYNYYSHSVANCGDPDLELLCTINNCTSTIVIENNEVPTEGNTVTFSCPPGLVLTGPSSATCAGNGEWEPDPSQLMCNKSSG